jgi:myo-inositol-1(or 4)-monophosphatase
MNEIPAKTLLAVCIEAARAAGSHALNHLHRRSEVIEQFDHDIKLVMDRECQTIAEEVIHRHFPVHTILGEEGVIQKDCTYEWIIDPIDGTANYTRGFPYWNCSVAVQNHGAPVAGCVFVPVLDECYTATAEGPARCNETPIHISGVHTLEESTFFAGLTKDIDPRALGFFCDMAPQVSKIRMLGSAAIDICHVACGRSDGYYEAGLYLWDVAAAGLIAERAGAKITVWPRHEKLGIRYLCTVPAIHDEVKQVAETRFNP